MGRGVFCLALAAIVGSVHASGQEARLGTGIPAEREIKGGETHSYSIIATADQFVGITFTQKGIDLAAQVVAPDGKVLLKLHRNKRLNESEDADFIAESPGTYHLLLTPLVRTAAGHYEVRVREIRPPNERDRHLYEVRSLYSQANRLVDAYEIKQAHTLMERAVGIGERELGPEDTLVGFLLKELGKILFRESRYDEAEKLGVRARRIAEESLGAGHPQATESLELLGDIYSLRGESAKAGPLLEQALQDAEKTLGPHPMVVQCLLTLSTFHQWVGDMKSAEEELKRAVTIATDHLAPETPLVARALNNLGVLYNSRKAYDQAEPLLERSVAILETAFGPDSPELALELQNLGLIAQEKRKDYPKALELYSRARRLLDKAEGSEGFRVLGILNNMANVYKQMGDYAKAVNLHQQVNSIAERQLGPYAQFSLISLGNLARTYASADDSDNALKYQELVDEAIEKDLVLNLAIGSEREKLAYFDSLAERTSRTISLQVGLARAEPRAASLGALVVMQRKGRVLDAISGAFAALRQRLDAAEQKRFDDLNATAAQFAHLALGGPAGLSSEEYANRLNEIQTRKEQIESEISLRSAEFRAQSQPVTLAAVRQTIPREAALIEYFVYRPFDSKAESIDAYGAPHYIVYVLRRDGPVQWKELGPARDIEEAARAFLRASRDPNRADAGALGRSLDRKVMEPVRALLPGETTRLLIAPDGVLNLIPFQALTDEPGRYLVERYSISYLTSGRDLLRLQVSRRPKSAALLVADPFFGETPKVGRPGEGSLPYFAPLAGTALEARAIQSRFPKATILTGREATEEALNQVVAPQILHIATHGFFSAAPAGLAVTAGNPLLQSGLALAGANLGKGGSRDGIFTALEASGLNLWGTKLVTLSACDTGVGEVRNGDGVYGLRRALLLAGTESLVTSLWPVSDYMTRQIMSAYYTGLQQGRGRGEALRQAQLDLLKRHRHPFYWAGFIQLGEWRNLDGN